MRNTLRSLYRALPLKQQLFELLRKGPALPHGLYQHLHFEGSFEVSVDPNYKFRIHSYGTCVENELFWTGFGGSWESTSLKVWVALCRTLQGLAIDIGANTGVYALAAAALGRQVIAFEPVERMTRRLQRNVELNGFPIRVEQKAVSDHTGRQPIHDDLTEHNYSASLEGQGPSAARYEVAVCALDDFLAALGNPALGAVKIDVERHEPAVLRGMKRILAEQKPAMLIEILDTDIGAQVSELLHGLDYCLFHIDEQRGLYPATALGPIGDHNWNHLACTMEQYEQGGMGRLLAPGAALG